MPSSEPAVIRQRIMKEAARLFVAQGYNGVSMRQIAEAVALSKAGLYYHFEDKEHLLLAILMDSLERLSLQIDRAMTEEHTTRGRIQALLNHIFALPAEQRAVIRLASQEMPHLSASARVDFSQLYHEQFVGRIEAVLEIGIRQGEIREMDTRLATWILLGMAYPFFYPAHEHDLGSPAEAIDMMLAVFFDGAGSGS